MQQQKYIVEWKSDDILKILIGGGVFTFFGGIIASSMGWVRFRKKDIAEIKKTESETEQISTGIKIKEEVSISKAALEWTVQLANQLEKSNKMSDKRQGEIDQLRETITTMRTDFDLRMNQLEKELIYTKNQLIIEQDKNKALLIELNKYLNGTA